MDFTPEESARLQREWKARAELCRSARRKEHNAFVQTIQQVAATVVGSWLLVFIVSAWIVSFILPFKPIQTNKALASIPRAIHDNGFYEAEATPPVESAMVALNR